MFGDLQALKISLLGFYMMTFDMKRLITPYVELLFVTKLSLETPLSSHEDQNRWSFLYKSWFSWEEKVTQLPSHSGHAFHHPYAEPVAWPRALLV